MDTLLTENNNTVQIDPKTKQHYTTVPDPNAEYIIVSEYVNRRNAEFLKKDPLAPLLYPNSVRLVTKRGDIVLYRQGVHFFIDWNKYKSWVFNKFKQKKK